MTHGELSSLIHAESPYAGFEPMPSLVQGWPSGGEVMERVIAELQPKIIVEVGVWLGESIIAMSGLAKDAHFFAVDTWLGSLEMWTNRDDAARYGALKCQHGYPTIHRQFLSNMVHASIHERVTPIPLPSTIAARLCQARGIEADLCYIDGSHDYTDVLADIEAWRPVVRKGGILMGDDYDTWTSVREAVRASCYPHTAVGNKWIIQC